MIWFTADQHFGHENIIKYTNRPFASVQEMDSEIIKRHNEVVRDGDRVYVLGDFTLENYNIAETYIDRLKGELCFINGSHDHNWFPRNASKARVRRTKSGRLFHLYPPLHTVLADKNYNGMNRIYPLVIVLCHYAMLKWDRSHYGSLHLFGHSHGMLQYPAVNSMDIGVDCNNFIPYSLDDILKKLYREGEQHVKQSSNNQ